MNIPKEKKLSSFLPFIIIGGMIMLWSIPIALILAVSMGDSSLSGILITMGIVFLVGLILFITGFIRLKSYKEFRAYVEENAIDSIATVSVVTTYISFGGQNRHVYVIVVDYKTIDGKDKKKEMCLDIYTWKNMKVGTKIACKVYGDECLINRRYLHVIEEN